ncbi:MAG: hypothetical protein ABI036_00370, partial [Fibrobacteria bacterium]
MSVHAVRLTLGFILGLFLASKPVAAVSGAANPLDSISPSVPMPSLNQKAIHDEYMNGNFEAVLTRIETFRKNNPDHSREDSLFIARHLGVVLAADPRTVEAAKYWMHRTLMLSPEADLSGMYASEAIERMFREMKEEEEARTGGGRQRKWLWIGAGGTA